MTLKLLECEAFAWTPPPYRPGTEASTDVRELLFSKLEASHFLVALIGLTFASDASAIIVQRYNDADPYAQYNTTAPTDDPGWYNVSDNSLSDTPSYVYLGNQWVLTAWHTSAGIPAGPLRLANGVFPLIPGTDYRLTNPSGNFRQLNSQGQVVNEALTPNTDLRIFRVNTDLTTGLRPEDLNPGIKPITIASTSPAVGTDIMMIGIGRDRGVNPDDVGNEGLFHFNVTTSSSQPWTWGPQMNSGGNFHGFNALDPVQFPANPPKKRWGTNQISSDYEIEEGWGITPNDSNNFIVNNSNLNPGDTLTLVAKFDQVGPNSDESLASAGDSGGAVFANVGGQWQLAGIMNSIYLLNNQNGKRAVFGQYTAFADLSYSHYYSQIANYRNQSNFSLIGDINLDGVVSGNGTGAWASDDVTAFMHGWLHSQAQGNILSWKQGDLNQDGITDLSDFALLRTAFGGSIGNGQLEDFFAGGGTGSVPEPESWLLMLGILAGLMWLLRPRRRLAPVPVRRRS